MTERRSPDDDPALSDALRTPGLSDADLERIRTAVAREWRAAGAVAGDRALNVRLRWIAFAAAAALGAATVVLLMTRNPDQTIAIGSLSKANDGGLEVDTGLFRHRILEARGALRAGDRLTARGAALITLARGGSLRVAAGTQLELTTPAKVSLERGLIYLEIPPGAPANPVRITTRNGTIEHVGTEFEVMSDDRAVRIRVREGRIRFHIQSTMVVADAGTELLATSGNAVSSRPIDTYGRDWLWTTTLAPDYEIEGQPLIGFLQWVGRELGRRVDFDGSRTRQVAERTVLHGSIRGQPPLDALSNVLATTTLAYELRGDRIWIRPGP
jgi:hypothetical protein